MGDLANKYRPKKFADVVGQDGEVKVLKTILEKNWKPGALMLTGPFGTGKTTLGRLIARALLCDNRVGVEPCGRCESCTALDLDNHPAYTEVDAASQGAVSDVRGMKDLLAYRTAGDKTKIICYDESHMLSAAAQNALLQTLEEGLRNTLFIFCTTEAAKMLPTVRSRCIELRMKLLTASQIAERVKAVAKAENFTIEDRAALLIGSYVRGHVRDAMILLEQLSSMSPDINELMVRSYLRLDRTDELYQFLTKKDKKEALENLENLLCNYGAGELAEGLGEVLINAYKRKAGMMVLTQVDTAWLDRVIEARSDRLLDQAEALLKLETDYGTINYGMAAFSRVLLEDQPQSTPRVGAILPGAANVPPSMPMRKMGK